MIEHEREFGAPADKGARERYEQARRDIAMDFAATFLGSEHGKRVLGHLRKNFRRGRLRFGPDGERTPIQAAFTDGQCSVMGEIEDAIAEGAPDSGLKE